jgi:N-acetylmuramoyl-L-alanine amidase
MKKIVVIVDFAHGSNVPGKCSPDKTHREWMWSRRVGNDIATMLKVLGFQVYFSNPLDTEGGLTPRVRFAENLKVAPGQYKFMLSLHNNAGGMGDKWVTARGFEVWTKQGFDLADVMAEKAFPVLKKWFPSMKQRLATNEEFKKDKEGNLAVLKGEGVYSLLFEYLFQDNKEDVQLLLSEKENKKFADAIVDVVENMEEYLNLNK